MPAASRRESALTHAAIAVRPRAAGPTADTTAIIPRMDAAAAVSAHAVNATHVVYGGLA